MIRDDLFCSKEKAFLALRSQRVAHLQHGGLEVQFPDMQLRDFLESAPSTEYPSSHSYSNSVLSGKISWYPRWMITAWGIWGGSSHELIFSAKRRRMKYYLNWCSFGNSKGIFIVFSAWRYETSDRLTLTDQHRGPCSIGTCGSGSVAFEVISVKTFYPLFVLIIVPTTSGFFYIGYMWFYAGGFIWGGKKGFTIAALFFLY